MMMYNRKTEQQGEWVTIEDVEFLKVEGGNFIPKDNVGENWVEFNDETSKALVELADSLTDEDVHFLLLKHMGDGAQVLGHRMSDRMMLEFIMIMIENFIEDHPIKTMMLMMAIKELVEGDNE